MNNKETIEQVERGYRMANPVHIVYPESKTCPKELAQAQSNVYKVKSFSELGWELSIFHMLEITIDIIRIILTLFR